MRAILLASFLAAGFAGCAKETGPSEPTMASESRQPQAELAFLDDMIRHHRKGVAMAALAHTRATRPELKEFAARMVQDQEREIRQMEAWHQAWYPDAPLPSEQSTATASLRELEAAQGAAFDLAFLDAMIPHHQEAVRMSRAFEPDATHADLARLAADIATKQQREIEQMQAWKQGWSPRG